jgi:hypothetical protein
MSDITKIGASHLSRAAYVYLRQSSPAQVEHNRESTQRQYALVTKASTLGWPAQQIVVIDEDLGLSGAGIVERSGFARLTAEVALGHVGIVLGLEVSRLARNNADWYRPHPEWLGLLLDREATYRRDPLRLRKRSKSRGPSLHRSYPASSVLFPRPTPTAAAALSRRRGRYPRYDGSPPFHGSPSRRAVPTTPADRMSAHVDYFPIRAAFPDSWAGRHPRLHFRGLLGLHSRYGPPGCSTAQGGLCHEASIRPVTQPNRSSATRPIDNYLGGFFLHWLSVPFGAHQLSGDKLPPPLALGTRFGEGHLRIRAQTRPAPRASKHITMDP